jgi:hypothetical protein
MSALWHFVIFPKDPLKLLHLSDNLSIIQRWEFRYECDRNLSSTPKCKICIELLKVNYLHCFVFFFLILWFFNDFNYVLLSFRIFSRIWFRFYTDCRTVLKRCAIKLFYSKNIQMASIRYSSRLTDIISNSTQISILFSCKTDIL